MTPRQRRLGRVRRAGAGCGSFGVPQALLRPAGRTHLGQIDDMRTRTVMALGFLVCALAVVPSGIAKPRDGIPAWVEASSTRTLARLFGNPSVTETWNIPSARKIVVVWEFQWITVCRACSASSNGALPRGRVVRVSFDRRTHRLTGELRFCEVHGIKPPLSACLAR